MAKTFKVGDKVRILDASKIVGALEKGFETGGIYKVSYVRLNGIPELRAGVEELYFYEEELRYIELVDATPTKKQRIEALESEVEALKARIEALENGAIPNDETGSSYIASKMEEALNRHIESEQLTTNQRRKAIIERAKAFVADVEKGALCSDYMSAEIGDGNRTYSIRTTKPEYHVNKEKRVVTVLIKGAKHGRLFEKAIARCAPGDVFNEHIGKAIALAKAYGLECPKEFTDAPQPDKVVAGMSVMYKFDVDIYTIEGVYPGHKYDMCHTSGRYFEKHQLTRAIEEIYTILDDTEAQYE